MIRPIITIQTQEGRMALSKKAKPVGCESSAWLDALITDLIDTAKACRTPTCAGLAAHQIGEPVAVFVIQWGAEYIPIINPVVVAKSEKTCPYWESCLSRPGLRPVNTRRHKTITLDYLEHSTGHIIRRTFKNRDSIVVQHELDHLEGKDV